jgi:hypothetical protein
MTQHAPTCHTQHFPYSSPWFAIFFDELRGGGFDEPGLLSQIVGFHEFENVVTGRDAGGVTGADGICLFEDVDVVAVTFEEDAVHETAEGTADLGSKLGVGLREGRRGGLTIMMVFFGPSDVRDSILQQMRL